MEERILESLLKRPGLGDKRYILEDMVMIAFWKSGTLSTMKKTRNCQRHVNWQ